MKYLFLSLFVLTTIYFSSCDNSSSSRAESTPQKCSDMESYDYGYAIARDQDGLLADCNYLYEIASTQKNVTSKSCFCEGVSDFRNSK
ncbi:MAG: hypothetical protein FJY16_04970 [Bacteroidetes bacterium]|nr:hypothetical protein [Bacteroidota bacterium]